MIKSLIKIRAKQIYRDLAVMGLVRTITLLVVVGFGITFLFLALESDKKALLIILACLYLLLHKHNKRKDKVFLKTNFSKYRQAFLVEYSILVLPLIICLLYYSKWQYLIFLLSGVCLIPYLDLSSLSIKFNFKLPKYIPHDMYEWKSNRKHLIFVIFPFWIIGLSTSFFIYSIPGVIFIIGYSSLNLYDNNEPFQMIIASEKNARSFLNRKIKLNIMILSCLLIPLIIVFMILHFEYWHVVIVEYILLISLHIYKLLIKYANYQPNKYVDSSATIKFLEIIALIIPFLIPFVWILSIVNYFDAVKKLNHYLDDFN